MTLPEFMERCVVAGCVIVPTRGHSAYGTDGNIDPALFTGMRYAAIELHDTETVAPDYWGMVDDGFTADHETVEAALAAFEAEQERRARP